MVGSAGLVNGVSQCCNVAKQTARPKLRSHLQSKTLSSGAACRRIPQRQHILHATGTQVPEQELASAGNQDKARELEIQDQDEEIEQQEQYEAQMDRAAPNAESVDAQLAALQPAVEVPGPLQFTLNFLWLEKNVAIAVDQLFDQNKKSPVTEYFFWPRVDAWEELKDAMEAKPWVQERDKIILLNKATEIINFWQDNEPRKTVQEAREAFPDCTFQGTS